MYSLAASAVLAAVLRTFGGGLSVAPQSGPARSTTEDAEPTISNMSLEIWPEYDDPRVLVIYHGTLAPSEEIPVDFLLPVPRGAQIHMAGAIDANGAHLHSEYEIRPREDELQEVSYTLEVPDFYMEFYYDPFEGGENRSFTYPLVAPGELASLTVAIQEPRRAEDFQVSPLPQKVERGRDGFSYHLIQMERLPAGFSLPVAVTYRKPDDQPSVVAQQVAEAERAARVAQGRRGFRTEAPGAAAVLLLGVLTFALVLRWQRLTGTRAQEPSPAGQDSDPWEPRFQPEWRFCTHCGEPFEPEDRFCRWCGQPSRRPILDTQEG